MRKELEIIASIEISINLLEFKIEHLKTIMNGK